MEDTSKETITTAAGRSPRPITVTSTPKSRFSDIGKAGRSALRNARLRSGMKNSIPSLLLVVLLAGGSGFVGGLLANGSDGIATTSLSEQKKIVTNEGELISAIAKSVGPSVVSITVETTSTTPDFFGFGQQQTERGAGTGVIISKKGLILTNRHVVPEEVTNVSVTLPDGMTFDDVSVVGRTSSSDSLDVAFLKINDLKGKTLTAATIGDSSDAEVGDTVVAIGNALGEFQNTVTSGIISGFGRNVQAGSGNPFSASASEDLDNLIQTDAAINQGNSGGPLVNLNGQVIGINTAIASNAENIGFAIPINDVKGLMDQVLKTGKFERPYLGVRYVTVDESVAERYGLDVKEGAYVIPDSADGEDPVVDGSPADVAGIRGGDIITKIDGEAIKSNKSLITLINHYKPGDKVKLTVLRDGKIITLNATLGSVDNS